MWLRHGVTGCGVVLALVLLAGSPRAAAQGYAPETAAQQMTVPDGIEVDLYASEPMVRQPVAIEFDDRGRLWVVQYLQYPNPEGLERVAVDRYSRTTYDHVPKPPPNGPRGADRITILIDKDRDGVAEESKDFVDGLNLASGIAFGYDGVFVLQAPYLLYYPDRDHDDAPDSDPEVCLSGFGMEDASSVANSLTWGPDGWLYGSQGTTVTGVVRGIEFQQGIWRYHPATKAFELFCEGGGNMWGLDFDPDGQVIASTNLGPYVMLHFIQGAYYWKSFGKHGNLHNPYTYGYFEHVTEHNPQGGHVVVGGHIYQGGALPPIYDGTFIAPNLLSHTIYYHTVTPVGSTFESAYAGTLLDSHDTWFAPSDMTTGPDGALYVCDWADARTAHPDPDANWDRSNGRIYRIGMKGSTVGPDFDLRQYDNKALVKLLDNKNVWLARRARVLLATRQTDDVAQMLRDQAAHTKDRHLALESVWTLFATGKLDEGALVALLDHPDYAFRLWAVRLLGDTGSMSDKAAAAVAALADRETDVRTQAQLAATAIRMDDMHALRVVAALLKNCQDTQDLFLPLLTWWAVEAHAKAAAEHQDLLLAHRGALADEFILPRFARRLAAQGDPVWDGQCVALLSAARDAAGTDTLLEALGEGLAERDGGGDNNTLGVLYDQYAEAQVAADTGKPEQAPPLAPALMAEIVSLWEAAPDNPVRLVLASRLDHQPAIDRAQQIVRDTGAPADVRVRLLDAVSRGAGQIAVPELLAMASSDASEPLREAALKALRRFDDPAIGAALAKAYPAMLPALLPAARQLLLSRAAWTGSFLALVDSGAVKPEDVPATELRPVARYNNPDLDALVKKYWGNISGGTPEALLAEMRRLNNDVRAQPGDPRQGQTVFNTVCAQCHQLFGEGHAVGPDLTQANRMDTEYLLANLVNPNMIIRKEFTQYLVETKDGGFYNGIIAERTPAGVTLLNANEVKTEIANGDIGDIREAGISLMPEGILTPLTPDEVRNLFAYLQRKEPLPKE